LAINNILHRFIW